MAHEDVPLPLSRLQLAHELLDDYSELLPALAPDELRRLAGEQEVVARLDRERAIDTLPALLPQAQDRERLLALLDRVLADPRVQALRPSAAQRQTLERIRRVLAPSQPPAVAAPAKARPRRPAARRNAAAA